MRRGVWLMLAAGTLFGADAAPDANKADLERMQGDWAVDSTVIDGRKVEDDEAQILFRTVRGNDFTVSIFDKPISRGTFTLDAAKKPRAINARLTSAAKDAPPLLGIYEFDGEKLRICFAPQGGERPTDFVCKAGSRQRLTVWRREKS